MSYILDALRKAEAERALGSVPNVHVQSIAAMASAGSIPSSRRWLPVTLGAGVIVLAGAGLYFGWQAWSPPAPAVSLMARSTPASSAAVTAMQTAPPDPAAMPGQAPAAVSSPVAPAALGQSAVASQAQRPAQVEMQETEQGTSRAAMQAAAQPAASAPMQTQAATRAPASPSMPASSVIESPQKNQGRNAASGTPPSPLKLDTELATPPAGFIESPRQDRKAATEAKRNKAAASETAADPMPPSRLSTQATRSPAANADASAARIASWRDLPENLRREIPQVSISGYIYTADPAERSALINNRLLHEGEQVAPGLTLERLLPKSAILNYRGTRYAQDY